MESVVAKKLVICSPSFGSISEDDVLKDIKEERKFKFDNIENIEQIF